jgi:iron complex outermembrane receptor protein
MSASSNANRRTFRTRAHLLCGAALVMPAAGFAQPIAPPPAQSDTAQADQQNSQTVKTTRTGNGEIIISARRYVPGAETATKSSIPLIQTPQSISVITRDQIDLLNFVDAQQATRYTAGVTGENYGPDPRFDFITVRGFAPREYIDGLAVPATTTIPATGIDIYAFQSLEVLKGPASVLYGAAPPGGILNEVSRRPSSIFGGEALVKAGNNRFLEGATTLTGPVSDFLDLGGTALYRNTHGEIDFQRVRRLLLAPSATLKLGPSTRLTLLAHYQHDHNFGGAGGFLPAVGTLLKNPNGQISRSTNLDDPKDEYKRNQYSFGYDFQQGFGDAVTFHSNTQYNHYHEFTPIGLYSGVGGWVQNDPLNPSDPSNFTTLQRWNFSYQEKVVSFATDNRVDIKATTGPVRHKLLLGVDHRSVHNSSSFGFFCLHPAPGGFPCLDTINVFDPVYPAELQKSPGYPFAFSNFKLKQTGLYGQDQLNFNDHLFVLLSGRYDWVHETIADNKNRKFTYRAGLNYVTDAGISPYISYSTSFEPQLGTDAVTHNPLKPTSVKQWEGGVKYDGRNMPRDFKIFATAAAFDIRESNFVVAQVGSGGGPAILNSTQGGLVEVSGAELELVARIRDQLSINGALSYTHSEIKKDSVAANIGAELPNTPKWKASLFANYNIQRGTLAGLGFGAGVRYNGRSAGSLPHIFDPTPVLHAHPVTLFDGIVSYDVPGWRLAVNGSNLFDKRYVARCDGYFGCVYGAGRQVIATATKKF